VGVFSFTGKHHMEQKEEVGENLLVAAGE